MYGYTGKQELGNQGKPEKIIPMHMPNCATNGGMVTKVNRMLLWTTSGKNMHVSGITLKFGQIDTDIF